MIEYHKCKGLDPLDDVEIVFAMVEGTADEKSDWWLNLFREADEKDVANGEADDIGELMFSKTIRIEFCPFCGICLKYNDNNNTRSGASDPVAP